MDFDDSDFDDLDEWKDGSDHNQYLQERDETLEEFRKKLMSGTTSWDYEESDWMILADYALDTDNRFLFNEAITRGLIEYPDSSALQDRRLVGMFNEYEEDELRQAVSVAVAMPSPSKLARIYQAFYDWKDTSRRTATAKRGYKIIEDILIDGETVYDIELIEAVKILEQMQALKYIALELPKWENVVYNPEMLWYEVAVTALDNALPQVAEKCIDKLNTEYPYNLLYWVLKSRQLYLALLQDEKAGKKEIIQKTDEIISVIETALAIDPEDEHANLLRTKVLTLRQNIEKNVSDDEGTAGSPDDEILLGRKPSDPMGSRQLMALLCHHNFKAHEVITDWISSRIHSIEKKRTDNKNISTKDEDLYNNINILYITGNKEWVDILVGCVYEGATLEHYDLNPVVALRLIERGNYDEAANFIENMPGETSIDNPNKLLLAAIFHKKVHGNIRNYCSEEFCRRLVEMIEQGANMYMMISGRIHPVILSYLLNDGDNSFGSGETD